MVNSPVEHMFIETNQIRLHIVCAGPSNGPLVLLLHGFPEFWWGWSHQIDSLVEAGYRLIIPDQRGYNLSDKPVGVEAYKTRTLANDAIGLIRAMGRSTAVIVGHDWGAMVAWQIASQAPEVVERLGILNVPHPRVMFATLRKSPRQLLRSWYIFFFQIPRLPEAILRANQYAIFSSMIARTGKKSTFSPQDMDKYRDAWSQPGALTGMLNWYRAIFRNNSPGSSGSSPPTTPQIKPPTLIFGGRRMWHSTLQWRRRASSNVRRVSWSPLKMQPTGSSMTSRRRSTLIFCLFSVEIQHPG